MIFFRPRLLPACDRPMSVFCEACVIQCAQGACTTLLSVRIYYIACPSVLVNYANFTETPAGPQMTSIVQRDGVCVPHAELMASDQRPSYLCKADGSWYYATGSCRCRPGYQPDDDSSATQCTGTSQTPTVFVVIATSD